jgi:RimJ/RimL family protein N-acetyltransferase
MQVLHRPLSTPRLRLLPVTRRLAYAARMGAAAFAAELGAEAPPDWCAASLGLVARSAGWSRDTPPTRAVAVHHGDGAVVGDVRFEPRADVAGAVEIGYAIAASRRRMGFAVEATGAVIDWLFESGGASSVIAGCDRANIASVKTLRKLGFWLDCSSGSAFWWVLTPELRSSMRR